MQLRVVTDQPWDVKADVLVVPIVGEPTFDGPLGELDRRTGGELASPRRVRRAARPSAISSAVAASRDAGGRPAS